MDQYRLTLEEAQNVLRDAPINPLDLRNPILMRELEWIRAALACRDYPSRQFRESVNTIVKVQRAGKKFYYGATEARVALLTDRQERPLVIRWHDGARGANFTNEHPIDLKEVFLLMRSWGAAVSHSDIYDCIARLVFFVGTATTEKIRGHRAQNWDGRELFVRFREKELTHLYMFPGFLTEVGANWVVE